MIWQIIYVKKGVKPMNEQEAFDFVYDIGETLLKNGAEIKRIETTIRHIAEALGFNQWDFYDSSAEGSNSPGSCTGYSDFSN